jgi:hypothetical protein
MRTAGASPIGICSNRVRARRDDPLPERRKAVSSFYAADFASDWGIAIKTNDKEVPLADPPASPRTGSFAPFLEKAPGPEAYCLDSSRLA